MKILSTFLSIGLVILIYAIGYNISRSFVSGWMSAGVACFVIMIIEKVKSLKQLENDQTKNNFL